MVSYDYQAAIIAFTGYYKNRHWCYRHLDKNLLIFETLTNDTTRNALDAILSSEQEGSSSFGMLMNWFISPENWPFEVKQIISNTRKGKRLSVKYKYDRFIAKKLISKIPHPVEVAPQNWAFPWAFTEEVRIFIQALELRVLYHLVAVHLGSVRLSVKGLGVSNLCPIFTNVQLCREISQLSHLSMTKVSQIITALSYGTKTTTPDPTLQPFLPLDSHHLMIPCIHLLSSNHERNLLSLHARVDKSSFDAQSDLFEKRMVLEIEAFVKDRYPLFRTQVYISQQAQSEEIDLVILDMSSSTILVGELRWMLPPGDFIEIYDRKNACVEKVKQLRRKLEVVNKNIDRVLSLFSVMDSQKRSQAWEVVGAVILQGYAGTTMQSEQEMPIVPQQVFEVGIRICNDLRVLHHWLSSQAWLPKEGPHFTSGRKELYFGDHGIQWPVIEVVSSGAYLKEYLPRSVNKFNRTHGAI